MHRGRLSVSSVFLANLIFLADNSSALHFPGLVSKDYSYDSLLDVKQSYFLTTQGHSEIVQEIYK